MQSLALGRMGIPRDTICCSQHRPNANDSKCVRWLKRVEAERGIRIQHAGSPRGEKVILLRNGKKHAVDGFTYDTWPPTVFEYHGDFWHGNPDMYDFFQLHPVKRCYNGELYIRTKNRERDILARGYALEIRWECEDDGYPPPDWEAPEQFPFEKKLY